jgi:hypothetical protein
VKFATEITSESRSQDTDPGRGKTVDGFSRAPWIKEEDEPDSDILDSGSESDDTESVYLDNDTNSLESEGESDRRSTIVAKYMKKIPEFAITSTAEIPAIVLKRRTKRSRYMEIILNSWLDRKACVHPEDVENFLRLLKYLQQEPANEVYACLSRFVRARSIDIYRLIYSCVPKYLPTQKRFFKHISQKMKSKPVAEPDEEKKKPKPTVPKPSLQNIHDIAYVTFTFANNYARYEYDYKQSKYDHCSLFGCLTPDQQETLARLASTSIHAIEAFDTEGQLDVFRRLFGIKSSAECITELAACKFIGNALQPQAWAVYHVSFQKILNTTPRSIRPPENELAKRLIYACPLLPLRADVQSKRPQTLKGAFDMIMATLNDAGFLRSVAAKYTETPARPQQHVRLASDRPSDRPERTGDRHLLGTKPDRATDAHPKRDTGPHISPLPMGQGGAAPVPPRQHNGTRPRYPPCRRCRKNDHPFDACISKHDVDNVRLEPLPSDIYGQHKERYNQLKEQLKAAVLSSETSNDSDGSDRREQEEEDDFDCDCVCSSYSNDVWEDVPPPSLLVDGDVESNPGPLASAKYCLVGRWPTVARPTLTSLDNVKDIFKFCGQYKRYDLDNGFRDRVSLFGCLSAQQQETLACLAATSIDAIEVLDPKVHLDVFRIAFGVRSQAELLHALNSIPLPVNADSAAWTKFSSSAMHVFKTMPKHMRPSAQELRFAFSGKGTPLPVDVTISPHSYEAHMALRNDTLDGAFAHMVSNFLFTMGTNKDRQHFHLFSNAFVICGDTFREVLQNNIVFQTFVNGRETIDLSRCKPCFSITKLAVPAVVPAPPLLRSGDIEANPGPIIPALHNKFHPNNHTRNRLPVAASLTSLGTLIQGAFAGTFANLNAPTVFNQHSFPFVNFVTAPTWLYYAIAISILMLIVSTILSIKGDTDNFVQHVCAQRSTLRIMASVALINLSVFIFVDPGPVLSQILPAIVFVSAFTVGVTTTRQSPKFTHLILPCLWLCATPVNAVNAEPLPTLSNSSINVVTSIAGTIGALALSFWIYRMAVLWRQHANFTASQAPPTCTRCTPTHTPTLSCMMGRNTPLVSNKTWHSFRRLNMLPSNFPENITETMRKRSTPRPPMPPLVSDSSTSDSDDDRPTSLQSGCKTVLKLHPNPFCPPAARLVDIELNPGPWRIHAQIASFSRMKHLTPCFHVMLTAFLLSIDEHTRQFYNVYLDDFVISGTDFASTSAHSALFHSFFTRYYRPHEASDPQISLLLDGDVESNPGPINWKALTTLAAADSDDEQHVPVLIVPSTNVPPLHPHLTKYSRTVPHYDTSDDSCASIQQSAAVLQGDSDSSQTSDPDLHPPVASIHDLDTLDFLPPPKFVAFLTPTLNDNQPPPEYSATICAVDSMCLGEFSIISLQLATSLKLRLTPFQRTSRTATGATVKCSSRTDFFLSAFLCGAWQTFPVQALVWETTSQPLLLCNSWALNSGLINMVQPNATRLSIYGSICLSWRHWETLLNQHVNDTTDAYHIDVMAESDDDVVDLSAPTRIGDQDVSSLPADARAMAELFPIMTKALPFHAHPELEQWRAHVVTEDLAKYSWPKCDLQDLKGDRLPLRAIPAIHYEFDKLITQGFAEELTECPTSVVMRAQLVSKTKTEKRFCVNGSQQKLVLRVGVYPMPSIKNILAFVARFPWRAKIDLKWGYYNFEVHVDDRKWTVTIGGGRAIQWRKLVQGFASSGAFFQYAMTKLLGPTIVGVVAEVYLDDLIIIGNTAAECSANVMIVMKKLAYYNFRVNFAKCQFTPNIEIDFLGCRLIANVVHPGPKVSAMLEKIKPFYAQHSPKAQRHHLHVFLGMCAYLLQHCPNLKQQLHPLYLAVASDPFRFGSVERDAFDKCRTMLCTLDVYHLPSDDPDVCVEIQSDASGGAGTKEDPGHWGGVLGQRRGITLPVHTEGFELLQLAGGSFNERQAKWDILKKEAYSLYQSCKQFRYYTFGRNIRIIVDSKVLMHMHRSAVPMLQRWYAFIQSQDYVLIHFSSENNAFADALTRCTHIPPAARLVGIEPNPGPLSPREILSTRDYITLSSDTSESALPDLASDSDSDNDLIISAVLRSGRVMPNLVPPTLATLVPTRPPRLQATTTLARNSTEQPGRNSPILQPVIPAPLVTARPPRKSRTEPTSTTAPLSAEIQVPPPTLKKAAKPRTKLAPKVPLHPPSTEQRQPPVPLAATPPPPLPTLSTPRLLKQPKPRTTANLTQRQASAAALPVAVSRDTAWPTLLLPQDNGDTSAHDAMELTLLKHICDDSPDSFFHAIASALDDADDWERRSGRQFNDPCPSHDKLNCRDSVLIWMRANALVPDSLFDDDTPHDFRRKLLDVPLYALFHRGGLHRPANWLEYVDLLQHPRTEADELVMRCAAICFRTQIVVSIVGGLTSVYCPPSAFRRVHLLLTPGHRRYHFDWCHELLSGCSNPIACEASVPFQCSFKTPPLTNVHVVMTPRIRLNDEPVIATEHLRLIAAAHCGHTGHPGIHATIATIRSQGNSWRGMTAQVSQFIRRCPTCNLSRISLNPAQPVATSIRLGAAPLRRWHCDTTGTLTTCVYTGFDRIITFVCESTGYTILAGSRFNSALEVAIALVHIVGTFGMFESFHSDNGSENDSFIIQQFCRITSIKHTLAIPHNPQTNGLVERTIQNVKRFIRLMIVDGITSHNSWGFFLPMVQKAINSSPFGPFQIPPNSIIFASLYCPEDTVVPLSYMERTQQDVDMDVADGNHYHPAANFVHRASYFQQTVTNARQEILDSALLLATASPDHEPDDIPLGSQVLIPWPHDRRPTSLHPFRRGPYVVEHINGNVLLLRHATFPTPDMQPASIRWSSAAQLYTLDAALMRGVYDPSATNVTAASHRPIDAVIDFVLKPV